ASLHLAAAYDDESSDAADFRRLATAVGKYWICKRGPEHAYESLECLGGNGYTESFPLARRYREQPVMAVWEGSGNVIVLDVLRALAREPRTAKSFLGFLETGLGRHADFDSAYESLARSLQSAVEDVSGGDPSALAALQSRGRVLVEKMALLMQSAILFESAPAEVAASFATARLGADRGREYGALPTGVEIDFLVDRACGAAAGLRGRGRPEGRCGPEESTQARGAMRTRGADDGCGRPASGSAAAVGRQAATAIDAQGPGADPASAQSAVGRTVEIGSGSAGHHRRATVGVVGIGLPLRGPTGGELGALDEGLELVDEALLRVEEALRAAWIVEEDLGGLSADDDSDDEPACVLGVADQRDGIPFVVGEQAQNNRSDDLLTEKCLR